MWIGPDRHFISKPINMIYGQGWPWDLPINTKGWLSSSFWSEILSDFSRLRCAGIESACIRKCSYCAWRASPFRAGQEFKAWLEELKRGLWTPDPLNVTGWAALIGIVPPKSFLLCPSHAMESLWNPHSAIMFFQSEDLGIYNPVRF